MNNNFLPYQLKKTNEDYNNLSTQLAEKSKQYYVDVKKDFGAKGDGVTDDSAAIQNAINSLTSGGEVFFPQGTYLISQTLNININKMRLVGMGSLLSIIKTTAAITAIKVNGTSGTNIYWWSIENLCLEGNNVGTTGVDLEYAHEGFMKYCRVELFQTGVTTNQSWSNGFHSCQIMNNTNTNLVLGAQSNDNAIIDCQLDSAGVNGVHVTGQSQCISFVGCVIQSCGKEAMLFDAGSSINLSGCYFERNNNSNTTNISAINANGGSGSNVITGLNITGCQFWDNNTQAAINLNYVQGVFVGGSSLDIISGGTTAYSVISSVNTHYVTIAGCYKAQPLNDVGQCILSLGNNDTPSFNTNVKIKKASASFTLDTPDATTETYLNINKGGINYTCLYGETNGALYIQQRNSGGTLSNIVQFPAGASNGGRPTFYTGADFNNQNVVNANLIIPNGATASRPTPSAIGQMWFDTSLMKPIYCKQVSPAIWVDATGTTV